jgi:ribonuclease HI
VEHKGQVIEVYTDGSCNPKRGIGGWAAIILYDGKKITLTGFESDTTHNRMELIAAIRSIVYINEKIEVFSKIKIYSDSQYLVNLSDRMNKLTENEFKTKKGDPIQNEDLVRIIKELTGKTYIEFVKVKAHRKKSTDENLNREVDKLARGMVRDIAR